MGLGRKWAAALLMLIACAWRRDVGTGRCGRLAAIRQVVADATHAAPASRRGHGGDVDDDRLAAIRQVMAHAAVAVERPGVATWALGVAARLRPGDSTAVGSETLE